MIDLLTAMISKIIPGIIALYLLVNGEISLALVVIAIQAATIDL